MPYHDKNHSSEIYRRSRSLKKIDCCFTLHTLLDYRHDHAMISIYTIFHIKFRYYIVLPPTKLLQIPSIDFTAVDSVADAHS